MRSFLLFQKCRKRFSVKQKSSQNNKLLSHFAAIFMRLNSFEADFLRALEKVLLDFVLLDEHHAT
jgi:hypothetical protein